jgi:hypothetical protein
MPLYLVNGLVHLNGWAGSQYEYRFDNEEVPCKEERYLKFALAKRAARARGLKESLFYTVTYGSSFSFKIIPPKVVETNNPQYIYRNGVKYIRLDSGRYAPVEKDVEPDDVPLGEVDLSEYK